VSGCCGIRVLWPLRWAQLQPREISKKKEARTRRTLPRGTAKRLHTKARQAAPIWARSVGFVCGLGKFAVF